VVFKRSARKRNLLEECFHGLYGRFSDSKLAVSKNVKALNLDTASVSACVLKTRMPTVQPGIFVI